MNKIDFSDFLEKQKKKDNNLTNKNKVNNVSCPYDNCDKVFANNSALDRHIDTKHRKNTYAYNKAKDLKKSLKKENSKFPCPYEGCNYSFELYTELTQHISDVHKRKKSNRNSTVKASPSKNMSSSKIKCEYCGCFLMKKNHNKHLKKCSNNPNIVQKKKKKKIKSSSIAFSKIDTKSFSSDISSTQYTKDVQGRRKINQTDIRNCTYCKKSYTKSNYSTHLKSCIEKFKKVKVSKNIIESLEVPCKYCHKLIHKDYVNEHYKICFETNCEYCGTKLKKDNYQQHLKTCADYKEFIWEKTSPIKNIEEKTILTNIEKHQALKYQFREDEELDPDLIDEEAYQKTFGIELDEKNKQLRAIVAFEHEKIYKQEEEDKSEIKIFLSKMYKGYCQVCGYTFKKTNGVNSFERFNWNDKRVIKVKKSLVSTADSLCLCRNCSANIKWGAFYPNFVDTIREIEAFRDKSYDEVKDRIHKVVDENIPKIFEPLLEFDDIYALEIELDGKPRNIYFTNEHLLQFITYLQKEDEVEEEVKVKKEKRIVKKAIDEIYSKNSWLAKEENISEELAKSFLRETIYHPNHSSGRPVSMGARASEIYMNNYHGWAIELNANPFLVGKAIERCKIEINTYIENYFISTKFDLNELKDKLHYHIRRSVATSNNDEYNGYYPLERGKFMKFGWNAIDVDEGVNFLIRKLGLNKFLEI